ncbi:hypothetical protein PgNI_05951, partial [Pyricularia grisea]|uniref:Uncharacterized protein n=1 Tax=Pyricularia grisea TaxID=148305 RepID=A0A6P8B6K4_PYRGI
TTIISTREPETKSSSGPPRTHRAGKSTWLDRDAHSFWRYLQGAREWHYTGYTCLTEVSQDASMVRKDSDG